MTKLGEIELNGKKVSVFKPPHDEPDFPWIDVEELARAYLPRSEARGIVKKTHAFGGETRACATAKNGDRIATIIPHAMAQGLCGLIDFKQGHHTPDDDGPVQMEYGKKLSKFAIDNWPMDLEQMIWAYHNPGGRFLKKFVAE